MSRMQNTSYLNFVYDFLAGDNILFVLIVYSVIKTQLSTNMAEHQFNWIGDKLPTVYEAAIVIYKICKTPKGQKL